MKHSTAVLHVSIDYKCIDHSARLQFALPRSPIRVVTLSARNNRLSHRSRFSLSAQGRTVLSHELELPRW